MKTDKELLGAWGGGDRAAGNELFRRHFSAVHRFFANKVDRDVEDLVQRTFMACTEGRDRFEGRSSFRTYVLGIANHLVCNAYRRKRARVEVDLDRDSIVDLGASPSTLFAEQEEQRVLLEALRRIPLTSQVVLELYYWERLTGPQLGEVLGIPEDTARSRVRTAKQLLRKALAQLSASRRVLESTDADLEQWADSIRVELDRAG